MPTWEEKITGTDKMNINKDTGGLEGPKSEYVHVGPDGGTVNRAIAADRDAAQRALELSRGNSRSEPTSKAALEKIASRPLNVSEDGQLGQHTTQLILKAKGVLEAREHEGRS